MGCNRHGRFTEQKTPTQTRKRQEITTWYGFVAQNFIYRGAWGLGSIIGLLLEAADGEQPLRALEIGDWPRSGLPWISFWLKELITWGTLDPVAAFLLARGNAVDRPEAEAVAKAYYEGLPQGINANDALDPRQIRDWVGALRVQPDEPDIFGEYIVNVELMRSPDLYRNPRLAVFPLEAEGNLIWIDPAGYIVARCRRPDDWPGICSPFEFELDVETARILGNAYQRYV